MKIRSAFLFLPTLLLMLFFCAGCDGSPDAQNSSAQEKKPHSGEQDGKKSNWEPPSFRRKDEASEKNKSPEPKKKNERKNGSGSSQGKGKNGEESGQGTGNGGGGSASSENGRSGGSSASGGSGKGTGNGAGGQGNGSGNENGNGAGGQGNGSGNENGNGAGGQGNGSGGRGNGTGGQGGSFSGGGQGGSGNGAGGRGGSGNGSNGHSNGADGQDGSFSGGSHREGKQRTAPPNWTSSEVKQAPAAADSEIWTNIITALEKLIVSSEVRFSPLGADHTSLTSLPEHKYKAVGRCLVIDKTGNQFAYVFECLARANKYEAVIVSVKFAER